jgi:hypothetical protein
MAITPLKCKLMGHTTKYIAYNNGKYFSNVISNFQFGHALVLQIAL